jgi:hypothetical protein
MKKIGALLIVAALFSGCSLTDQQRNEIADLVTAGYAAVADDLGRPLTPSEVGVVVREATEKVKPGASWTEIISAIGGALLTAGAVWARGYVRRRGA